ncbi:lysophospholipid acyltransferase family protein [Profundibacterium mesophilum]|uniref:Lipid A biosynthesis lauroyl acyltransferase n=1 Tax=Profundibacterium mesophilum KAUST100406-0324 TaxID=1037889 RepID=A0A921NPW5_9RHOB|nr:lysophospholipid acyltransferase family protein [Profundibacterium mesophilum]KAF0674807.1 lipid A biosynthesis lauroyl acyltransferase [Profundibacterium mesophilum KAUST100406-0324]
MKRSVMRDRAVNAAIRSVLALAMAVPYRTRVPMMGWIVSRIVAPLAGWSRRVEANLAHVRPDLDAAEVRRLKRAVPDNAGRTLIEIYSGEPFRARARNTPLAGPGLDALRAARAEGRPVIMVTGHLGNYDVPRIALAQEGIALAALYREMRNPYFNAHYAEAMRGNAEPIFPANRRGLLGFVNHLRQGGAVGILIDVFAGNGAPVTFFSKTAPTATSAAEWALKYDALVVPVYGIRQPNGLDFEILIDAPVPLSDPLTLTQALNDSLERVVRTHMEQWFWIHRRWKPELRAAQD